jgi:hypothetical protein
MNERIKELAVQADLLIKKTNGDEFRYGNFDPKFQKFAELIIKETLEVARAGIEFGNGMEDAVYNYFGVEK